MGLQKTRSAQKTKKPRTPTRRRAPAATIAKKPSALMFDDGRVVISDLRIIKRVRAKLGLVAQKAAGKDKVVSALVTFRQEQSQDSDMIVDVRC